MKMQNKKRILYGPIAVLLLVITACSPIRNPNQAVNPVRPMVGTELQALLDQGCQVSAERTIDFLDQGFTAAIVTCQTPDVGGQRMFIYRQRNDQIQLLAERGAGKIAFEPLQPTSDGLGLQNMKTLATPTPVSLSNSWDDLNQDGRPDITIQLQNGCESQIDIFQIEASGDLVSLGEKLPAWARILTVTDVDQDGAAEFVVRDMRWVWPDAAACQPKPDVRRVLKWDTAEGEFKDISAQLPSFYQQSVALMRANFSDVTYGGGCPLCALKILTEDQVLSAYEGLFACQTAGGSYNCWAEFWELTNLDKRQLQPSDRPFEQWVRETREVFYQQYGKKAPFNPAAVNDS